MLQVLNHYDLFNVIQIIFSDLCICFSNLCPFFGSLPRLVGRRQSRESLQGEPFETAGAGKVSG